MEMAGSRESMGLCKYCKKAKDNMLIVLRFFTDYMPNVADDIGIQI